MKFFKCDICGRAPCETRSWCARGRRSERIIAARGGVPAPQPDERDPVAESTRQAHAWLKAHAPERLQEWLKDHPAVAEEEQRRGRR